MAKTGLQRIYLPLIYSGIFFSYYLIILYIGQYNPTWESDVYYHGVLRSTPYLHKGWLDFLTHQDFEPLLHMLTALIASVIHLIGGPSEKMDIINAMAFILAISKLVQFAVIKKIVDENTSLNSNQSAFITLIINFCNTLYFPMVHFSTSPAGLDYPGFSPNTLHNPTMVFLMPLAIAFFYYYIRFYIKSSKVPTFKTAIGFSLLLACATLDKPSFTNVMIIIMGLYYLTHPKRLFSNYIKHDIIIYVPAILILFWQRSVLPNVWDLYGHFAFAPFRALSSATQHPIIALLQGIEFPLLITLLCIGLKLRGDYLSYLSYGWLYTSIGYIVMALFVIDGPAWSTLELQWSYDIGLTFIYTFSIIALVHVINTSTMESNSVFYRRLTQFSMFNLGLIFFSGIYKYIWFIFFYYPK